MLNLRFDIDARNGLVERTPPLLDLLHEFGFRASFFCVMGHEANVLEIVRLRFLHRSADKARLNVSQKGGLAKLVQAALFPRGVGYRNPDHVRAIVAAGHELQPHGWSHIQWHRNLDRIDVREHLARAMDTQERILGTRPDGFASPGRSWNEAALDAFDEAGLTYVGDMDGDGPFVPEGRSHLQLPITRFETIAQMRARGLSDDDVVAAYLGDVDANPDYCCIYEHPDDLGPAELALFRRVYDGVRERGIEPVTLGEIARQATP